MPDSPKAVFICERGELEIKSALLAASLKDAWKEKIDLVCSIPDRTHRQPSGKALRFIGSLGATTYVFSNPLLGNEPGNQPGLVFSNKAYCFPDDIIQGRILFFDSDMICLSAPGNILTAESDFLACQAFRSLPVDWEQVYGKAGIPAPHLRIRSILDQKTGFPYFNSGFWGIRAELLYPHLKAWRETFTDLRSGLTDQKLLHHTDQIALSVAVQRQKLTFEVLPEQYNFPAGSLPVHDNVYHAHYHGSDVLARDPVLYSSLMKLLARYPGLKEIGRPFKFWNEILNRKTPRIFLYASYVLKKKLKRAATRP